MSYDNTSKMSFDNLPEEIVMTIIKFQIQFGDYNPSMFNQYYRNTYLKYLVNNTKWN